MSDSHITYDYLIVGAGIAGLHCAIRLLKSKSDLKILIVEKYNYIGGRVVTFRKDIPKVGPVHWENGAGRIHSSHKMVRSYMKRYDLTFIPISDDSYTQTADGTPLIKNEFEINAIHYLTPLKFLPDDILSNNTIYKLLSKTVGVPKTRQILSEFPYRAEVNVLKADEGIDRMLAPDDVAADNFGVCAEGLDRLIEGMVNEVIDAGGKILMGVSVENISMSGRKTHVHCMTGKREVIFTADNVILALHSKAMKMIPAVASWPVLKDIVMCPLLRVYAIFPIDYKTGRAWFSEKRIVFANNPLRYFIPIDPSRGICMLSYTDASDTQTWMKDAITDPEKLQVRMMKEIRRAFPLERIPDPIFFKTHPWREGCSYWLPGATIPLGPLNVFENVWACGESFSPDRQCWIEGALESAEELVSHLLRKK